LQRVNVPRPACWILATILLRMPFGEDRPRSPAGPRSAITRDCRSQSRAQLRFTARGWHEHCTLEHPAGGQSHHSFGGDAQQAGAQGGKGGLGRNPWDVVPAGIRLQTGARCSPFSSQALGASVRPNEILSGFPSCFVSLSCPHLRPSGRRTRFRDRTRARAFSRRPTSRGEKRRRSRRLGGGRRRGPLPRGIVVVCR